MKRIRLSRRRGGRIALLCRLGVLVLAGTAATAHSAEETGARKSPSTVVSTADKASKPDTANVGPPESSESRDEDQPIRLVYVEGDLAGMTSILSEDGKTVLGMIEYRQHLRGDVLEISRVARFADGSSDEDEVRAHVGKSLRTIGGRSIIRNTKGVATVDLKIDVAKDRITGFSGLGKDRKNYDQEAELSPATYWGPLLAILLKNYDENAVDGQLRFHTVVATPKPRALHMELAPEEKTSIMRAGSKIQAQRFSLTPSINPLLDPLLRLVMPKTDFFMQAGKPPAMARFAGPRNYEDQKIRIE